nr:MAG TPA: Bcl-2 protein [Caudoviricetes sp.]
MQRNCAFSVRTTRRILTAAMRIRSKLRRMKYEFAKWLRGLIFLALV